MGGHPNRGRCHLVFVPIGASNTLHCSYVLFPPCVEKSLDAANMSVRATRSACTLACRLDTRVETRKINGLQCVRKTKWHCPNRGPARNFWRRVQTAKVEACTSTEVLQKILHRYASLQRLDLVEEVYDMFVEICPVVLSVTLADTDRARDLVCSSKGVSARDAVHAAVMLNNEVEWIARFDTGVDSFSGIRRSEIGI
jgi:predicted nucleic acid-binding protein